MNESRFNAKIELSHIIEAAIDGLPEKTFARFTPEQAEAIIAEMPPIMDRSILREAFTQLPR